MLRRVRALWLLACSLLVTLARRLSGRGQRGLTAFHRNYLADGLVPLSAEERRLMPQFERCWGCGICDHGESERIRESRGEYAGVMSFVLSASRSTPDYAAAKKSLAWIPRASLEAKEQACPVRLPIARLAQFIDEARYPRS